MSSGVLAAQQLWSGRIEAWFRMMPASHELLTLTRRPGLESDPSRFPSVHETSDSGARERGAVAAGVRAQQPALPVLLGTSHDFRGWRQAAYRDHIGAECFGQGQAHQHARTEGPASGHRAIRIRPMSGAARNPFVERNAIARHERLSTAD